ncbi:MAG: hypothetical protein N2257_07730 [Thermodesulfovibrionales bacterium]|nr:hypothetical protein [Thermodesulfovibrionales bacterium]
MITGKEDLIQSLMEAYLMEKGTKEFYIYAASNVLNTGAREMFLYLSEWEEKHMQYIQFLYQSFTNDFDIWVREIQRKKICTRRRIRNPFKRTFIEN